MRKVVNYFTGFLLGALVGAAAGLLLAPHRGPDLQNELRSRVDALLEEGKKAAAARQAELEAQLEAFKSGEPAPVE